MSTFKRKLKVLWAIDALSPYPEITARIAQVLNRFSKTAELEVHPACMLSPDYLGLPVEFAAPIKELELQKDCEKAILGCIADVQVSGIQKPLILFHHRPSLSGAVQKLAHYAEEFGYDMIIVGSHGRKGLERAILGSFAESLLLQSKKPVLVVGPTSEVSSTAQEHLLIPTDLEDTGSMFFPEVFSFAKMLNAKTTLLHSIPKPAELFLQSGVYLFSGAWVPILPLLKEQTEDRKRALESLSLLAKKQDIPCEASTDAGTNTVVESILAHAKEKKVTMIAMASQSGPASVALMGSITRKVIRGAPCPVWVLRSKT